MEALLSTLIDGLERGAPSLEALAVLGEPFPGKAADTLLAATRHPDLSPGRRHWLPELLLSARPGFGAQCLAELAARYRQTRGVALDLVHRPALPRMLGSSDFLARLLLRHPSWCDELDGDPPAPPSGEPEPDWTAIRIAKYKGLLRIAGRDLRERDFEDGLAELSQLADGCLRAALACASRETGVEAPALLALGKLGGFELNFSSDVDLLFVYDPPDGDPTGQRAARLGRLIQTFKRHLEVSSEDGFAYRVDLDLRPEGRQGVLVNSVDAALSYYESFGADWERQALIRLRSLAGPPGDVRHVLLLLLAPVCTGQEFHRRAGEVAHLTGQGEHFLPGSHDATAPAGPRRRCGCSRSSRKSPCHPRPWRCAAARPWRRAPRGWPPRPPPARPSPPGESPSGRP